jgi:hypothetical protein
MDPPTAGPLAFVGLLQSERQDQQCDPETKHCEAKDENKEDEILKELTV